MRIEQTKTGPLMRTGFFMGQYTGRGQPVAFNLVFSDAVSSQQILNRLSFLS